MAAFSALCLLASLVTAFACARHSALVLADCGGIWQVFAPSRRHHLLKEMQERLLRVAPLASVLEKTRERKRTDEYQRIMPEVLRLLCIALESGASLVMALRYAANNCDEPLASELKRTVWDLEAGQGFDEALEKLRARMGGAEFAYLAVAMEVQHQSGGSLSTILESVSALLQQTTELREDLRTKTAQGRLSSRIVAIMPFALLAILSVFSPGYLTGFLSSPMGICLFALALLFECTGVVLVRRALTVDFTVDLEEVPR